MASVKSKLRACLSCSFVQSAAAFKKHGCANCDFLDMKGSGDRVLECTTGTFDGAIAMVQPNDSWVAKFQRIDRFSPGLYAARMSGTLPAEDQEMLEEKGYLIRGRDD